MDPFVNPPQSAAGLSETVVHGAPRPEIAFVAGSGPDLADETNQLLRRRLLAAAIALWIGFTVFFARLAALALTERVFVMRELRLGSQAVVVLALTGVIGLLWSRARLTANQLRGRGRYVRHAVFAVGAAVTHRGNETFRIRAPRF